MRFPLWLCLHIRYDTFRRNYPATFQEVHGFFRAAVNELEEDYLECSDLCNGFTRIRCTTPGDVGVIITIRPGIRRW